MGLTIRHLHNFRRGSRVSSLPPLAVEGQHVPADTV